MKAINGCVVLKGEELKFVIEYIDRLIFIQTRFLSDYDVIRAASNDASKKSDWLDTANKMIRSVNLINEIAESDAWPKDLDKSKLTWNPDDFGAYFKRMDAATYWDLMIEAEEKKRRLEKEKENASSDNE